jgi:hypothetical protein
MPTAVRLHAPYRSICYTTADLRFVHGSKPRWRLRRHLTLETFG